MPRRKYTYLYVLQGDYGHGWEDLTAEDKHGPRGWNPDTHVFTSPHTRIRQSRREYIENEGGSYRIISRRELNI